MTDSELNMYMLVKAIGWLCAGGLFGIGLCLVLYASTVIARTT